MNQPVSRALDLIYPAYCHLCTSPLHHGKSLCHKCQGKLKPVETPFCTQCGECFDGDIDNEFTCPNCDGLNLSFSFARAAYQGDVHSLKLIHDFKYGRQIHLASLLASLTSNAFQDPRFAPFLSSGLLVPIPLHWQRQRKRRFNQSEEMTRHLARQHALPWTKALKRIRNTETQTRFNRHRRLQNLSNAFCVLKNKKSVIHDRHIILVDDVFTTGSTTHECARTLLNEGAHKVAVVTLVRG